MDISITIQTQNPAGTMLDFAGGTVPFGYVACDGSTVSRTTYARLFEAISTTYGVGDGSTTFKLPDFRGRVAVGSGTGSSLSARTLGATGGAETHTLSEAEMPSHTHTQNSHNHTQNPHFHGVGSSVVGVGESVDIVQASNTGLPDSSQSTDSTTATNNATTATNQNTGGGSAHNNMQPFLVCTKIIKF